MPITGAPVPTQYRESDARWGSAIESEGVRTAVASGTNVKVDGIIKTTGDTSLGSPNQTSTDTRNRVTRIGYLGQVIMDLLGGGAFQAPKHGNWTSSTNVRFQFVEGGDITGGTYSLSRTSYRKYLSPTVFKHSTDLGKCVAYFNHEFTDWDIYRTSGPSLANDLGKYIDPENGIALSNQQRMFLRYRLAEMLGGALTYKPQTPEYLTVDCGDGTPKIKNEIDTEGPG